MKVLMVFTTLVVVTYAQFSRQGGSGSASPVYGPPQKDFDQGSRPQQPGGPQGDDYTPQTFRHVFVHSAPDEPADEQIRTIRVPGGDKHVNIIFVKTPSQSSQSQTEVILPEQDEQKNLVYVLLKKAEAENDIKIRRPQAKGPQKPEVYFIRYKGEEQDGGSSNGGYSQGPAPPSHNGGGRAPPSHNGGGRAPPSHNGGGRPNIPPPRGPPTTFDFDAPSAPAPPSRHNGNGNGGGNGGGNGYSESGRYSPAVAPGPIRSSNDVPSSGYGVPL